MHAARRAKGLPERLRLARHERGDGDGLSGERAAERAKHRQQRARVCSGTFASAQGCDDCTYSLARATVFQIAARPSCSR